MQTHMTEYLEYLRNRGLSQHTQHTAELFLIEFFALLKEQRGKHDERTVTSDDVQAFIVHMQKRPPERGPERKTRQLSVSFRNQALARVKDFFEYLVQRERVMSNPARDLVFANRGKPVPHSILSEPEIRRFLKMINTKTLVGRRNYCIFRLLYTTGLRRREVCGLTTQDIDLHEGTLFVRGKFGKTRLVPLGENIRHVLTDYLENVRPYFVKRDPKQQRLFLLLNGRAFAGYMLYMLTREYAQKAGVKKRITPHSFRHTFATHLLNRGASIRHIQAMLGHTSLETTEVYTRVAVKNLREVYDRTHPRALVEEVPEPKD